MNNRRYQFRFPDKLTHLPPSEKLDLREHRNKLFVDELFGKAEEVRVTVNGISLNGRWEIETEDVGEFDYILRLVDYHSSSSISLTFTDQEERLRAVESLETNRELQHVRSSPKSVQLESILGQKETSEKTYTLRRREWNVLRWLIGRPELVPAEQ